MTNLQQRKNVSLTQRFRTAFKPRDIFLHDGRNLRRMRIGTRIQLAATAGAASLLAWSGYATVQYAAGTTGDVASMQARVAEMEQDVAAIRAAADERAQVLEQRQAFLAAMMSGEAKPEDVAKLLPAEAGAPVSEAAEQVSESYAEVDGMQLMLAQQAHQANQQRLRQTSAVVRKLGLDPSRLLARYGGVGGPLVEAGADDVDPRFAQLFASWKQLEQLEQGVASIPSALPIPLNQARLTSGYGTRSDPFRGRAAMHSGIDLAGPIGTPIYAAADAVVGQAGVLGGYGNLVELEHGAGIATRYGHLSSIMVRAGERVRRGQLIGLMGSTGRSTGSHLHYEVRIDGRAVNPLPFLQTGQALAATQNGGGSQAAARR
ncbi:MAG TPA: M23 family metallopeptidase [Allosphingosinicella sp.]|jgi:murein DD-endopeptidase MepM/ murein hydrolase activator NlpD|nr:M23 family metallopeptidase [Allosphingosinicella sp.]